MANPSHFVRAYFVLPAVDALRRQGVNVDRAMDIAKLNRFRIDDPDAVLPLACVNAFYEEIARTETGRDIPESLANSYTLEQMADWGDHLLSLPDILSACQAASRPDARIFTNNEVSLNVNGGLATFNDQYTTRNSIGQEWASTMSMFLIMDGFRAACGADWNPLEIDIAAADISALEEVVDLSDVVVRTDRPANRLRFHTKDLAQRMGGLNSRVSQISPVISPTMQGRLVEVLDSLKPNTNPTQQTIAWLLDISPRTLQRLLAEEGATFSDVVDGWRMAQAVTLLENPRLAVADVAAMLHYSNGSHFGRAFRRWTGTTPVLYRELALT